MKFKSLKLIIIKLTLIFFSFIFVALYIYINNPQVNSLKINEVSYQNNLGYDWVEVYNPSLHTVSLKGLYLTDDKLDLEKYEIKEDVLIEPNSFVVIYSENYAAESANVLKLNFNISNGESIYLIEKQSLTIIDSLTVISDQDSTEEGSVGRFPNGAENTFVFTISSMGEPNIKDHIPGHKRENL